ncbi:hypothetical protein H2200_013070 [Cladophialophora chaetospira]|uniref:beta-glucosidase n=1 Tax=Cladophialophora chaetospira TaxID=386627 RepID=A0AA39CBT4_9EURO|nr:hypothetical protein H2200_013070 [Cladophialophora chaetospira]
MDRPKLLAQLTLEEKISLLAGQNFWETKSIDRLSIPSAKVSDGPNGVRGAQFSGGVKAACFPSSTALAATWDVDLARRVGAALAEEAHTKGAVCVLAPTVCLHRSPLGGRNFESWSEDPFLTGKLASAYIRGLQEQGVGATIKHFAGNEQETKRTTINVNIGERALRELYLKPFEIAVREAQPWALMTSYNLVNGEHADGNRFLLDTVLRQQWGYDGLVMSDWGGTNSTVESLNAGLDLEMPGPGRHRAEDKVKSQIESGAVGMSTIDARVESVLKFLERTGKFDRPETSPEQAINKPEHQRLIRDGGAQGIVLLKNEKDILPLDAKKLKSVAAVGLAKECLASGGGSAGVNSHYKVIPFEALEASLGPDVELRYGQGGHLFRNLPDWEDDVSNLEGRPGFTLSRYESQDCSGAPESITTIKTGSYMPMGARCGSISLECIYKPSVSGSHYLGFSSLGQSKVYVDDQVVFNITEDCDDAMGFLFGGVEEARAQFSFSQGKEYRVRVESFSPAVNPSSGILGGLLGVHFGFMHQQVFEEDLFTAAVDAARSADVALVFVGNTPSWETEGRDLTSMTLPVDGSQDRLISAVAAVNKNVIVIINTGNPIAMPWLDDVCAVIQAWFPGQEAGNSIVDVLLGKVNPGGKLPMTIPKSLSDTPAYKNFPGDVEKLQVYYEEGVEIGYRFYDKHPEKALFPFGFGLSYSKFEIRNVNLDSKALKQGGSITITAEVHNLGPRAGSEVVQVYVAPPAGSVDRPVKTLAGFAKVTVESGESAQAEVKVAFDAVSYWSEKQSMWAVYKGVYKAIIGTSAVDIVESLEFEVEKDVTYKP